MTTDFDGLRAAVTPGDGLVARFPGVVCVAEAGPEGEPHLRRLLDLCRDVAGTSPGRVLARRLAAWLAADGPPPGLRFATLAVVDDRRLAVFCVGAVTLVAGEARFGGADSVVWVDRVLPRGDAPLVLTLDGTPDVAPAPLSDLRTGVVPGAGVTLGDVPEGRAVVRARARDAGREAAGAVATPAPRPSPVPPAPADDDVQLTVYRPPAVAAGRWSSLVAFVHRGAVFVADDGTVVDPVARVRRAAARMGFPDHGRVTADAVAALPRGTELVLEPWLEQAELNPPRVSLRWEEPVHHAEFRFRTVGGPDGPRRGGLRLYLGVVVLAEVRFTIRVGTAPPTEAAPERVAATGYRRIFASYSHLDAEIVTRVAETIAITGDRYLIDARELRSGERWDERLAELIESAQIFQLFWSTHSMRSPFVRREWEHALALDRPDFIRPVYWERPLPSDGDLPPERLRRYHFSLLTSAATPPSCRSCGSTLPPEAAFCPTCGTRPGPGPVRDVPVGRSEDDAPTRVGAARPASPRAPAPGPVPAGPLPGAPGGPTPGTLPPGFPGYGRQPPGRPAPYAPPPAAPAPRRRRALILIVAALVLAAVLIAVAVALALR